MQFARKVPLTILLLLTLLVAACSAPAAPATAGTAADAPAAESAPVEAPTEAPATSAAETSSAEAPAAETPASEAAAGEASETVASAVTFAIDPAQTNASYEVEEEFLGQPVPFVQTVGRTQAIEGELTFAVNGATLESVGGQFTVDLRTLTSDSGRRDNAIRDRWLQSNQFPFATFNITGVSDLPADASLGADVTFKLNGDMTIREITNPWTWDVTANLNGSTLTGTATSFFLMRDYGFEPPDVAGMLRVTDGVTATVNFVAQQVQ